MSRRKVRFFIVILALAIANSAVVAARSNLDQKNYATLTFTIESSRTTGKSREILLDGTKPRVWLICVTAFFKMAQFGSTRILLPRRRRLRLLTWQQAPNLLVMGKRSEMKISRVQARTSTRTRYGSSKFISTSFSDGWACLLYSSASLATCSLSLFSPINKCSNTRSINISFVSHFPISSRSLSFQFSYLYATF